MPADLTAYLSLPAHGWPIPVDHRGYVDDNYRTGMDSSYQIRQQLVQSQMLNNRTGIRQEMVPPHRAPPAPSSMGNVIFFPV